MSGQSFFFFNMGPLIGVLGHHLSMNSNNRVLSDDRKRLDFPIFNFLIKKINLFLLYFFPLPFSPLVPPTVPPHLAIATPSSMSMSPFSFLLNPSTCFQICSNYCLGITFIKLPQSSKPSFDGNNFFLLYLYFVYLQNGRTCD